MGDINIVTQPMSDVPSNLFNAGEPFNPTPSTPAQPTTTQTQPASLTPQQNTAGSAVEQLADPQGVVGAVMKMYDESKKLIESQAQQIKELKDQNAKLAMNGSGGNVSSVSIEEAMADFFGYMNV